MFTAFALFILAFKVFPSRVSLPTAREVPLNATAPQTARRRPPSRRRLICTWVPDAQTGRLSCVWMRIPTKSPRRTDMKSPVDSETMSPTFPI